MTVPPVLPLIVFNRASLPAATVLATVPIFNTDELPKPKFARAPAAVFAPVPLAIDRELSGLTKEY
jgi:hypothetical protein